MNTTIFENGLIDISDCFLGKKRPRKLLRGMQDIERRLNLFLSLMFSKKREWEGLPPELAERKQIIELILYYYGSGLFFKKGEGYFFLPAYLNSSLNVYNEPTLVYCYGLNGKPMGTYYIKDVYDENLNLIHKKDAVLVKNDDFATPQYWKNEVFIKRLCYIWKTLGIQEGLARIKLLIYANEDIAPKIQETLESIIESSDIQAIVPNEVGSSLIDDVKDTDFGSNYTPETSWYDFDKTFNLLLSLNGINNNIESNKKAELTRSEVISGYDFTAYADTTREDQREIAVKEINKLFKLKISCVDKVKEALRREQLEYAKSFTGGKVEPTEEGGVEHKNEEKSPTPSKK